MLLNFLAYRKLYIEYAPCQKIPPHQSETKLSYRLGVPHFSVLRISTRAATTRLTFLGYPNKPNPLMALQFALTN